jgi:hypothetical protein
MRTLQLGSNGSARNEQTCRVLPRMLGMLISITALLALVAGCAGPSARIGFPASGPVFAAFDPNDLSGTWRGSFGQVAASLYMDEAECILRIDEDGTFTATVRPAKHGTNNLAKASTWSGTLVMSGNRITLRSSQGPWVTLIRSSSSLYGVAEDPLVGATIAMRFEREGITG